MIPKITLRGRITITWVLASLIANQSKAMNMGGGLAGRNNKHFVMKLFEISNSTYKYFIIKKINPNSLPQHETSELEQYHQSS